MIFIISKKNSFLSVVIITKDGVIGFPFFNVKVKTIILHPPPPKKKKKLFIEQKQIAKERTSPNLSAFQKPL